MSAPTDTTASTDPLLKQLRSFGGVFWTANGMELVERFAYYGVRVMLPTFMVAAIGNGGPEFTHIQKGSLYAIWALVQSFLPIFTGGVADRYGYKINIALSTAISVVGYLLMGFCIPIAELFAGMPLAEARAAGIDLTYEIFFVGAMHVATATAIFKPGVQGLIANRMPKQSASLGWGVFYQAVNIGGFIGPLLAGYLRILEWRYVFLACAVGIALNFVPLLFFKEPEHHGAANRDTPWDLMRKAVRGLLEPRLFFFTICFAGFWLMFYQLFDILPNFIDDWVDSRGAAGALGWLFGSVPTTDGGNLTQEWMINANALLISTLAFSMGYLTGKVRSLTAIVIGIGISAAAIYGLGLSMSGWWILGAIALFSVGEMAASPTKMRYLASIAPPGKEGLYMGYVNMTVGIGWSIGSIIAGEWYQQHGDKVELAKRYLVEKGGVAPAAVAALQKAEVLPFFEKHFGVDAWGTRELLWNHFDPSGMWLIFMLIGLGSGVAMLAYDRLCRAADKNPEHSFNTRGHLWVRGLLVPIVGALLAGCYYRPSTAVFIQTTMFSLLLLASFFPEPEPEREPEASVTPSA